MTKIYAITEEQRDNFLQIMRNNIIDPDAYAAITEIESLPLITGEPTDWVKNTGVIPDVGDKKVDLNWGDGTFTNRVIAAQYPWHKAFNPYITEWRLSDTNAQPLPTGKSVTRVGMRDGFYKDSTPSLHVGDSAFEDWFQQQPFAIQAFATQSDIKQLCRDAYAAGMGDPLVTYALPLQPITADDITPEMHQEFNNVFVTEGEFTCPKDSEVMAACVKIWIKHKGDTK